MTIHSANVNPQPSIKTHINPPTLTTGFYWYVDVNRVNPDPVVVHVDHTESFTGLTFPGNDYVFDLSREPGWYTGPIPVPTIVSDVCDTVRNRNR